MNFTPIRRVVAEITTVTLVEQLLLAIAMVTVALTTSPILILATDFRQDTPDLHPTDITYEHMVSDVIFRLLYAKIKVA